MTQCPPPHPPPLYETLYIRSLFKPKRPLTIKTGDKIQQGNDMVTNSIIVTRSLQFYLGCSWKLNPEGRGFDSQLGAVCKRKHQ